MKLSKLRKAGKFKILLAVLWFWSKYNLVVIVQNSFRSGNSSLTANYVLS